MLKHLRTAVGRILRPVAAAQDSRIASAPAGSMNSPVTSAANS